MSWNTYHSRSEDLAARAEARMREGDTAGAEALYRESAEAETDALQQLDPSKARTRGITAVSAVALWYKAGDFGAAESLAHAVLGTLSPLPRFAQLQLRSLLQLIWSAATAAEGGLRFMSGDVLVRVKGGDVVHGGAPLDLIVRKVEEIQALLFRTVEMLLERPVRKRGAPESDVHEWFRPWLFQAPAGSYQFAVRVQEPAQMNMFGDRRPAVERVTSTFMSILRASASDPERELRALVPDNEYREVFLKLSRSLSPTGKLFDRLEVRDASSPATSPVAFGPETRRELNVVLRTLRPPKAETPESKAVVITGVLRGVHLDKDWLDIQASDPELGRVRILKAGEALDDVVGPMVNRKVIVTARVVGDRYEYQDIEPEE